MSDLSDGEVRKAIHFFFLLLSLDKTKFQQTRAYIRKFTKNAQFLRKFWLTNELKLFHFPHY